jgi:hypothetical protein
MQGALGEKWYERLFGVRIDITDIRHPKHTLWLKYLARCSSFKSNVISRWETDNARAQVAHDRRLTEEANWKTLSGIQFEKELAWLLMRRGHKIEHVGGPVLT